MIDPEDRKSDEVRDEGPKEDLTGLYDLAIPIGMPITVIRELIEEFELDLTKRKAKVDLIGEVEEKEILVLRGDLDTVMKAKEYMFKALDRKVAGWEKNERAERYRKLYEKRQQERAERASIETDGPKDDNTSQSV